MSELHGLERLSVLGMSVVCCVLSACSSFDPVTVPRFALLHTGDDAELGITGARWIAYDDQHSLTSACTNGAAGNHDPSECSTLYRPKFEWDGQKCPTNVTNLDQGEIKPAPNETVCIQGMLRKMLKCATTEAQCVDSPMDASNMWGAGVGLAFKENGGGWNAERHGVVGVAFDLSGMTDEQLGEPGLNLRVEIPIELAPGLPLPPDKPVMRKDGSVIGKDGLLYRYDCSAKKLLPPTELPNGQDTKTVRDLVLGDESSTVTSELHPQGSSFWQEEKMSDWRRSPVKSGHNELALSSVLAPRDSLYKFDPTQIVGIHFQVAHGDSGNQDDLPFGFCISNLAVLIE